METRIYLFLVDPTTLADREVFPLFCFKITNYTSGTSERNLSPADLKFDFDLKRVQKRAAETGTEKKKSTSYFTKPTELHVESEEYLDTGVCHLTNLARIKRLPLLSVERLVQFQCSLNRSEIYESVSQIATVPE